ncbi:MAG TPA: hypothetical protein VL854_01200 [Nitrososphaeraceae archaeon]|nr:hypothetical protein [Nitrososphaeraceae archaeon]
MSLNYYDAGCGLSQDEFRELTRLLDIWNIDTDEVPRLKLNYMISCFKAIVAAREKKIKDLGYELLTAADEISRLKLRIDELEDDLEDMHGDLAECRERD